MRDPSSVGENILDRRIEQDTCADEMKKGFIGRCIIFIFVDGTDTARYKC